MRMLTDNVNSITIGNVHTMSTDGIIQIFISRCCRGNPNDIIDDELDASSRERCHIDVLELTLNLIIGSFLQRMSIPPYATLNRAVISMCA